MRLGFLSLRNTRTMSSPSGIVLPKCCLAQKHTQLPLMCGALGSFLARWFACFSSGTNFLLGDVFQAHGVPLCPGDSEIDQLFKIFRVFGTPNEEIWPHVTKLPDWRPTLPNFRPQPLENLIPELDANGIDLFRQMMQYDPAKRISAKAALNHPYFNDLPNKDST